MAPLIDKVMSDNMGICIKSYPMRIENKPHVELHLTIVSNQEQMPNEKLTKTAKELVRLIEANGGVTSESKN